MSIHADEALVLGVTPYSNTSLIATLFSRNFGKLRVVAKGARSPKSRIGVALEPATHVHVEWSIRPGGDLGTLRRCETQTVFRRIWNDYEAMTLVGRLLKVMDRVFGISEGEGQHFELLFAAVEAIEANGDLDSVEALFMAMFLERLGLAPGLTYCFSCAKKPGAETARLDLASGEIRCGQCPLPAGPTIRLKAGTIKTLKEIMKIEPEKIRFVQIHATLRREILSASSAFLSFHLGKSLPFQARRPN